MKQQEKAAGNRERAGDSDLEFIIVGSESWESGSQTSKHHLIKQFLKRGARILYVENISMRRFGSGGKKDLGKALDHIRRFFRGTRSPLVNLHCLTPLYAPYPRSRVANLINQRVLPKMIRFHARRVGIRKPVYIFFMPTGAQLVGKLGEWLSVYYITDNYVSFTDVEQETVRELEARSLKSADLVFATAQSLVDARKALRHDIHFSPHGVDYEHFAKALDPGTSEPEDLISIPRPRIGFMGALSRDWVDFDLLRELARRRRDWQFVLFGRAMSDLSDLISEPNISFLGVKSYDELPAYLRAMNAALICFLDNELSRDINPIKLREYLAAGLPVVATRLPPLEPYDKYISLVQGVDAYENAIQQAIESPPSAEFLQSAVRNDSWDARATAVLNTIKSARRSRQQQ